MKRDGELEFGKPVTDRRPNCCFETGMIEPMERTSTGKRVWSVYNCEPNGKTKENKMVDENSNGCCAFDLAIGQAVSFVYRGREMSGNVVRISQFSSHVDIRLHDTAKTIVTAARRDIKLLEHAKLQRTDNEPTPEAEAVTEACKRRVPLVIDIPDETNFNIQDYEDTEETMAAAVLTSLSLSPVLPAFDLRDGIFDVFEDDVLDEEPQNQEENRRTKARRRKNSFKTRFQCTWPRCGKILTNSSGIIRHVRFSHLGPKKKEDDGFSDGEEEFYFNEIEGSISPLPCGNPQRGRSMSDPSRPTQPLISSMSTHVHVDDNFTWPLRTTTSGARSQTKRTLHQTVHTNLRKGRGDGRKCRKVYGMENKHLWCTQCRWKKACIKFID